MGKWALIDYWGNKEKAFLLAVEEQEVHGAKVGKYMKLAAIGRRVGPWVSRPARGVWGRLLLGRVWWGFFKKFLRGG